MTDNVSEKSLKSILKVEETYAPNSPRNSIVDTELDVDATKVEILDPSPRDVGEDLDSMTIFQKNEAIIKHFRMDKEFKLILSRGSDDDPVYTKVKLPLPKELDFSDESDSGANFTEYGLKRNRDASQREYEGVKTRAKMAREAKHIVKRSKILTFLNPAFTKRVSFDTVNKIIDGPNSLDLFEESIRNDMLDDGGMGLRHNSRDPREYTGGSPSSDQNHRGRTTAFSPTRPTSPIGSGFSTGRYHSPSRLAYKTTKIINIDSVFLTRIHRDFESLYDQKLLEPKPVLPGRTIMVYISGRRHTWVALDWLFTCFAENGDTIIVVAAVNPAHAFFRNLSAEENSSDKSWHGRNRAKHKNSPEHVREVAASIMKYCLLLANPDLVVRIAVELPIGSTKNILRQMYELYKPNLLITAAKRNIKTAPVVAWNTSKIGDKLVTMYHVPLILVPSPNMDLFEFSLFAQLKLKYKDIDVSKPHCKQHFQNLKLNNVRLREMMMALRLGTSKTLRALNAYSDDENDDNDDEEDEEEDDDDDATEGDIESDAESIDSEHSDNGSLLSRTMSGTSSILDLRRTCKKIEKDLEISLQNEDRTSKDYFKNLLISVSDASREMGVRMAMIEKGDGVGASLIRTITGVPPRQKYRSLLDVGDPPPLTKAKTSDNSLPMSHSSTSTVPRVIIQDDSSPLRPLKSTLKFDINTPEKELAQRQNARKSIPSNDSPIARPELQPSRSTPEMKGSNNKKANAEKDKMRRNKFASLFKFHRKKK